MAKQVFILDERKGKLVPKPPGMVNRRTTRARWPIKATLAGAPKRQLADMKECDRIAGVETEYYEKAGHVRPIWTSQRHKLAWARAHGMTDVDDYNA